MSAVLFLTEPRDFHAFAVAEVLERWGVEPVLWFGADFPIQQCASVWTQGSDFRLEIRGPELDLRDRRFQAVWNRRPASPVLPRDLHPADLEPAARDCQHFVWSLWHLVAPSAVWVNPLAPIHTAILKPLQLRWAAEIGLEIPPSLCSNDPRHIREFLRAHRGETIYKSFYQGSWKTEDGVAAVFTRLIEEADLPEDDMIQVSPGIFQARVPKDHELRVTFLGDVPIAARIRSQEDPRAAVDWRRASSSVAVEPAELPPDVARKCRTLMERLGICFAAFDLIVTPDGRYVFLEVNPTGQFLFVEHRCPEIPMLDRFCRFLLGQAGLAPAKGTKTVRLEDVRQAAGERMRAAAAAHTATASPHIDETASSHQLEADPESERR
jgi:glutathione synthase/RimK-type ligase-like ATP-grasp enzyme